MGSARENRGSIRSAVLRRLPGPITTASDPFSILLAHGLGQEEGSGGAGENFSCLIDDFPFGVTETPGQLAFPAPSRDAPALNGSKVVDLELDRRAATSFRERVDDRSPEGTIEQGKEHAAVDTTGAAHVLLAEIELECRRTFDDTEILDSHVGGEFRNCFVKRIAHCRESSVKNGRSAETSSRAGMNG